jgi:hypothetical protein
VKFSPTIGLLPEAGYAVVSPYLVQPGTAKKVNHGDGFILDSAIKLLRARPTAVYSSRMPLDDAAIAHINTGTCLIAVGANTLKDNFELTPAFTLATLERIKVPVILMGVGHYGVPDVTRGLTPASVALFRAFLERFPLMSVRCDASWRYVTQALPDKTADILMTSCPVVHPVDGIDGGFARKPRYRQLVVTITDRALIDQQLPILNVSRQLFPAERSVFALHQDYGNAALNAYAEKLGYEVFRSDDYADFIDLYAATDIHFGNRVHAHLKCLSNGAVSFLAPFDLRQAYFAESLDFPLITQVPDKQFAEYDFQRVITRRDAAGAKMAQFIAALQSLIRGARQWPSTA